MRGGHTEDRLRRAGLCPVLKGERCSLDEGVERWISVLDKDGSMTNFMGHHLRGRAGTGKIYPCDSKSHTTRGGREVCCDVGQEADNNTSVKLCGGGD